ncbi:hypothetical protein KR038_010965 [Drosophila bunnanda]|nr:hypothetical protein KR038_010965 [Drosophila bunnanda]
MKHILNGLLGRGLTLIRGVATRANVGQQMGFVHPEKRRTFPIVYFNWKEVPQALAQGKTPKTEISPEILESSGNRPYSRKGYLRHLSQNKGNVPFTDVYRWSEFRRKLIYGVY